MLFGCSIHLPLANIFLTTFELQDVHGLGGEQHHQQQGLGGGPQGQGGGIPQASVRPLVRPVNPVIMNSEKQQHQDNEMNDIKPFVPSKWISLLQLENVCCVKMKDMYE